MDSQAVIEKTKNWISTFVIGLNLCPFAQKVFEANLIRYSVTEVDSTEKLLVILKEELELLANTPRAKIETAILIHPRILNEFLDFNDFTHEADDLIGEMGLRGTIQIAGFHPGYQFAGTDVDAPENYTNRSPYPMLHLLREISISEVAKNPDDLLEIPKRNIDTLKKLGKKGIFELL